jgi:Ca2+:H+ antiporter
LNILLAVVLLAIYVLYLVFMLRTHKEAFAGAGHGEEGHAGHTQWSIPRAVGTLVGASVLAAWMSEVLVGAAEGAGEMMGMSQTFIGMIVVAIVGGSAESLSAIAAGAKNKLDLSLGIVYGAASRSLFVAPVLVLVVVSSPRSRSISPSAGPSWWCCSSRCSSADPWPMTARATGSKASSSWRCIR